MAAATLNIAVKTLAELRNTRPTDPRTAYWLSEADREGTFQLAAPDAKLKDDGAVTVKAANGRFYQRQYTGPAKLSWYGLVPNDPSYAHSNTLRLDDVIRSNPYGDIKLDGTPGDRYIIGPVPGSGLAVTGFRDFALTLADTFIRFSMDPDVVLEATPGTAGVQMLRTSGASWPTLNNFKFQHGGGRYGAGDHCVIGYDQAEGRNIYSQDWGEYRIVGLLQMSGATWNNVNISGFPGNGCTLYGSTTDAVNGRPFAVSGTIGRHNGEVTFVPDDADVLAKLGVEYQVKLGNAPTRQVGGYAGDRVYLGAPNAQSEAAGTKVVGIAFGLGHALNADHVVTMGKNEFSFNGGCGIFTTGNEANAGNFTNIHCRENGGWGICDSSLLANKWDTPHLTGNGIHFNSFYTDGRVNKLVMGNFTNRGNENACSVLVSPYYEEGNSGDTWLSQMTLTLGGVAGVLIRGGYGLFNGGYMHNLWSGVQRDWNNAFGKINYGSLLGFTRSGYDAVDVGFNDKGWAVQKRFGEAYLQVGKTKDEQAYVDVTNGKRRGRWNDAVDAYEQLTASTDTFIEGDTFALLNPTAADYKSLVCVRGGTGRQLPADLTATGAGPVLKFSADPGELRPGDVMQVGGLEVTLWMQNGPDRLSWYTTETTRDLYAVAQHPVPVRLLPAVWQPLGDGTGPLAARPMLTTEAGPWRYLITDGETPRWTTWLNGRWLDC